MTNFMKISSVEAELFCADRQTDIYDEIIDFFCNFSKAPKNETKIWKGFRYATNIHSFIH